MGRAFFFFATLGFSFSGLWGVFRPPRSAASKRYCASFSGNSSEGFLVMPDRIQPPLEYEKLILDLARKTEAGEAMVITANVEDWVQHLLLTHMRALSKTREAEIFTGYGPLNTFSAKIALAWAFELIDDDTRTNMTVMKEIRNAFAHSKNHVDFASPEIDKLAQKFTGGNKFITNKLLFGNKAQDCINKIKAVRDRRMILNALMSGPPTPSPETSDK